MLFESLDKLRRNSIMSAILLIFLGTVIIMCPDDLIPSLTMVFGYTLIVIAIVLGLDFSSGKKSLMDYLKFTGARQCGSGNTERHAAGFRGRHRFCHRIGDLQREKTVGKEKIAFFD